ncbi:MAG: NAD(P)/FAD-dependent oxidoreductase [Planctomycetes bacterium]|nr:NAD(P)/FAD-dependent oxidoreductase [Planctomycetota bacterium]
MKSLLLYDLAVVGAGPAGIMAAIRAGQLKKNVVLIERNNSIGKKILISGRGRCNLTNIASLDVFIEKFGRQGNFLRSAFFTFFNHDLIDFFKDRGLELKSERQGRVFPVTDKARSVVDVLTACLRENKVDVRYNSRVKGVEKKDGGFCLDFESQPPVVAKSVILATGGASFKVTGSTGDGFRVAERLGHTIIPLKPGLVPLKTKESWVKELQGLSLRNIRITFRATRKKIVSDVGELMFTHFGVSGPLVLDLSGRVMLLLGDNPEVILEIDLKPGLERAQLEKRLLREFSGQGNTQLKNILKSLLPQRLIKVFSDQLKIDPQKKGNQVTLEERRSIIDLCKGLSLTITGALPIDKAMVTGGGVSTKEIDPRTMQSRIVPGLYFAGEVIDGFAASGGYNLQQAFSTGYLAGSQ